MITKDTAINERLSKVTSQQLSSKFSRTMCVNVDDDCWSPDLLKRTQLSDLYQITNFHSLTRSLLALSIVTASSSANLSISSAATSQAFMCCRVSVFL